MRYIRNVVKKLDIFLYTIIGCKQYELLQQLRIGKVFQHDYKFLFIRCVIYNKNVISVKKLDSYIHYNFHQLR
jgi:hypothetical protein